MPKIGYLKVMRDTMQDHRQFRVGGDGVMQKSDSNVSGRLFRWIGHKVELTKEGNRATMKAFKSSLMESFGDVAGEQAFNEVLGQRSQDGRPLSARKVSQAIDRAIALRTKQLRGDRTVGGDFTTVAAQIRPQDNVVSTNVGEHSVHSFQLTLCEFGRAVGAEMQTKHVSNLQARMNLLKGALDEAYAASEVGHGSVFVAPEWLFEGSDSNLSESEMQSIVRGVTELSNDYPGMLIFPGSILWTRPNAPVFDGPELLQSGMVFNTAPVVKDGVLVHMNYKMNDGGDIQRARGLEPERKHIFLNCREPGYLGTVKLAKQDISPNGSLRKWEKKLNGDREVSPLNHHFEVDGVRYAMDVCADHGCGEAKQEYDDNQDLLGAPQLFVLLSAGAKLMRANVPGAKTMAVSLDANTGHAMTSCLHEDDGRLRTVWHPQARALESFIRDLRYEWVEPCNVRESLAQAIATLEQKQSNGPWSLQMYEHLTALEDGLGGLKDISRDDMRDIVRDRRSPELRNKNVTEEHIQETGKWLLKETLRAQFPGGDTDPAPPPFDALPVTALRELLIEFLAPTLRKQLAPQE